jgi:hypothetical protein
VQRMTGARHQVADGDRQVPAVCRPTRSTPGIAPDLPVASDGIRAARLDQLLIEKESPKSILESRLVVIRSITS